MKYSLLTLFIILLTCSFVFAQATESGYWSPTSPVGGDAITIYYNQAKGTIKSDKLIKLHWGVDETKHGQWIQPLPEQWPPDSKGWSDGKAIQSPMTETTDGLWSITIQTLTTNKSVHFVFTDGSAWDSNSSANWNIVFGAAPPEHKYVTTVNVLVNMANALINRGYSHNDTLQARVGYFNTAKEVVTIPLQRFGFTSLYSGSADVTTTLGQVLDYQYYTFKRGLEYGEVYYNFYYTGEVTGEAQRRQVVVNGPSVSVADTVASTSDPNRMPFLRNVSKIAQDVLVTFTCDVRPAINQLKRSDKILNDIQGNLDVSDPDSVLILGVAINGPATGSWSNDAGPDWGAHLMTLENKRMYDDGSHGDVAAGDSIYSIQFQYDSDSSIVVGQEFKFGVGGGDNEGGYGNNHVANIDDSSPTATIASQFGSIDPFFYNKWDYDHNMPVGVIRVPFTSPQKFNLAQNYPNPFNPVTRIIYSLDKSEQVKLAVYNIRGEQIATLVNEKQRAGVYVVTWDGTDQNQQQLSSGLYFYTITAGDYAATKKMVLVR